MVHSSAQVDQCLSDECSFWHICVLSSGNKFRNLALLAKFLRINYPDSRFKALAFSYLKHEPKSAVWIEQKLVRGEGHMLNLERRERGEYRSWDNVRHSSVLSTVLYLRDYSLPLDIDIAAYM